MEIQVMKLEDYEEVYELWRNTPGMGLNDKDDSKEGINKYLIRNPSTCFVAREEGCLLGVILSGHDGRRGFIHHTAVDVKRRKQGIGRALVDAAMIALKQEGIHKVAMLVFSKNEEGNQFWEGLGFEARGDIIYRNKQLVELERIDT
ncbi:GNAT family N-acetyltransferase [Amedibacillus sp. YH-ame10]